MAIRKNSSRFTDRNKIRKMFKQGYSLEQISATVSITVEHIEYVLNNWDADEEKWRDKQRIEQLEIVEKAKQAALPATPTPSVDDAERERIREQARRELLAEMEQARKEVSEEEKPRKRPRRRAAGDSQEAEEDAA